MASEPYCADAPSRRISSDLTAMEGIELRSGPCDPNANSVSPPWYTCTSAERFILLPLSITSISSAGRPRNDGERTKLDESEIEFWPTINDGTNLERVSSMLADGSLASSAPVS